MPIALWCREEGLGLLHARADAACIAEHKSEYVYGVQCFGPDTDARCQFQLADFTKESHLPVERSGGGSLETVEAYWISC